ncbi:hypothetical protein HPB49_013903 [Dermacentor silvarum]|uniref:Uncharacterized protein n=1 Tax=Dermacentor silvarum TaxID=543639 RepID=A0ACB8DDQ7_DERSI|nr:hypothetical protein HPB49_013903 [Dermacentor silvarum]
MKPSLAELFTLRTLKQKPNEGECRCDVNPARQEVVNDTLDSENIADFVGTVVAHSAFSSLEPSKRDTIVQGVGMTANQLFFISYCAKFCELDYYPGDHYAPGRSRCIVPLMNMNEFSDAFHCKKGSHMNPPKKCTFWT